MPPADRAQASSRRHEAEPYALFALALISRFWMLAKPSGAVFDEELFEQYISHYFTHTFYFNLHPPVGKLLLALGAWLLQVNPVTLAHADAAVALRALPALAGAAVIPVFYTLLRQLAATRRVATLGAFLLLCDNLLFAVSRYIVIDAFLLLFTLGSVSAYLAAEARAGRERWSFVLLSALLAGLAVGTKWSGLAGLGVVGTIWLRAAMRRRARPGTLAVDAGILGLVSAAVYVAAFSVHFSLLPFSGGREDTIMPPDFQATLRGNPAFNPDARVPLPRLLREAHVAMLRGDEAYIGDHNPNATPWWTWPVLWRPPYVWEGTTRTAGQAGHVVLIGNIAVWWGVLIGLTACLLAAALSRAARMRLAEHRAALTLLGGAWAVSYLPFALVRRELFLYSYLPALTFSVGAATVACGALAGWMRDDARSPWRFATRRSAVAYGIVAAVALACFLYLMPLGTGATITDAAWAQRRILTGR